MDSLMIVLGTEICNFLAICATFVRKIFFTIQSTYQHKLDNLVK